MAPVQRFPLRGEIWWTNFHTEPPNKGRRPVIVVSPDSRNRHERARGPGHSAVHLNT